MLQIYKKKLAELEAQEESLFDLLETKVYTPEMFNKRHPALASKIEACREELEKAKRAVPKNVNYQERAETLEKAIIKLKDPTASATEQNQALKAIITRIEYHGKPSSELEYGKNSYELKVYLRL